jgi:hypothetical protein
MAMMQEPIEHSADRGNITQQLSPVIDRAV